MAANGNNINTSGVETVFIDLSTTASPNVFFVPPGSPGVQDLILVVPTGVTAFLVIGQNGALIPLDEGLNSFQSCPPQTSGLSIKTLTAYPAGTLITATIGAGIKTS